MLEDELLMSWASALHRPRLWQNHVALGRDYIHDLQAKKLEMCCDDRSGQLLTSNLYRYLERILPLLKNCLRLLMKKTRRAIAISDTCVFFTCRIVFCVTFFGRYYIELEVLPLF